MASELRVDKIVPVNGVAPGGGGGIIQVVQNVQGIGQVNSSFLQNPANFWYGYLIG